MDHSKELHFPTIDHGLNCSNASQQTTQTDNKIMDIAPFDDFFDLYWASQFSCQSIQLCSLNEFEDEDFGVVVDSKPLKIAVPETGFGTCVKKEDEKENQEMPLVSTLPSSSRVKVKKSSSRVLEFAEIKKHFGLKITEAAKEMNVGVTCLKRRCRELKIMRWPHRKLKSLNTLMDNVKELGLDNEVAKLENHKLMLERIPGMDMSEKTKKLRQACFKAKYKRKRYLAIQA